MKRNILILFYNTMWKHPLQFMDEPLPYGCSITLDRTRYDEADAVVFHLPDLPRSMGKEDIVKNDQQIWIGWSLECEENYPFLKKNEFRDMFDLWMGYHITDDIPYPYYLDYEERRLPQKASMPFHERKDVCMLISSTFNKSHRIETLEQLMKYIHIDSYGKLFNNCQLELDTGRQSAIDIMSKYKCVIAFENAIAPDYVTEKFYNPLYAGAVPIYLGAPNISDFTPCDNCFINVNDFDNIKDLADKINEVVTTEEIWKRYTTITRPEKQSFIDKLNRTKPNPLYNLCEAAIMRITENHTI